MTMKKGIGAIIIKNKRVLVLDHKKFGNWVIPVGKVRKDEPVWDAFEREMNEELGITVSRARIAFSQIIDNNRDHPGPPGNLLLCVLRFGEAARLAFRLIRPVGLQRERLYFLKLSIIVDLEIFGRQVCHGIPFVVGDRRIHNNNIDG